jgi:hypothetical protein
VHHTGLHLDLFYRYVWRDVYSFSSQRNGVGCSTPTAVPLKIQRDDCS